MVKPISIARFEQFYWGSVILGLVFAWLTADQRAAMLASNPILASMPWFLAVASLIGFAIAVLLWYFVARRPSVVAKWIIVVFAAFDALGIVMALLSLARGGVAMPLSVILSIVSNALYIAAAVMLFKPDARAWLGEGADAVDEAPRA